MNIAASILDTETTGISKSDQVIELAYICLPELAECSSPLIATELLHECVQRYKPSVPINPGAKAVHGIGINDLRTCPPTNSILNDMIPIANPSVYWIGHKVDFDLRMIQQSSGSELEYVKLICTYSLATKLLTAEERATLPNLKLVTLANFFFPDLAESIESESHTAIGDCSLVLMLLSKFVERSSALSWEDLWKIANANKKEAKTKAKSTEPVLLDVWPSFGKHAGELFSDIPQKYLIWARDNLDFTKNKNGKDLLFTINHWISRK